MTRFQLQLALDPASSSSEEEEEEEDEEEDDGSEIGYDEYPIPSPFIEVEETGRSYVDGRDRGQRQRRHQHQPQQFSILAILATALKKSLVTCALDPEEDPCSSMDIGWPTDVRHIAHVTFDRFNGFLGLPVELEPEVPKRVPSASASVFGVSANSMQCAYDNRGNCVPMILLLMQRHLYSQGGLQAEGIFRINAENSQELYVRDQLNKGIVPQGVDSHCLAGLIKAWFRELPTGVLDSVTPDQVMHCNTEEECFQLVSSLPHMEAALLDWAINLMADVVQHECHNKMNARNISMVFAPNMTQMADPLTALIHAVQVMNFLKTLILQRLREREEAADEALVPISWSESPSDRDENNEGKSTELLSGGMMEKNINSFSLDRTTLGKIMTGREQGPYSDIGESFHSFGKKSQADEERTFSGQSSPIASDKSEGTVSKCNKYSHRDEALFDKPNLTRGVRKFCWHPVFQLSKSTKRSGGTWDCKF